MQTLDRAAQLLNDTSDQDIDSFLNSIRDDLAGRSDVISIGVYGNSVWVQFADGQVLVVIANRDLLDPNFADKDVLPDLNSRVIVPVPTQVRLMNALGTVFHPAVNQVGPWFGSASYSASLGDSSVEGLKHVSGDGIFYFDTHGAPMPAGLFSGPVEEDSVPGLPPSGFVPAETGDTSQDHFVLWTSTEVTASTLLIYQDELRAGNLVYIVALHDLDANGNPTTARHFGITEKFIAKYHWSFGDGSVVFINACYSNNQLLRDACFAAGAHVYAGWTLPVGDGDSLSAALYFFDRSLGANSVFAVAPRQRPFQAIDVYKQMKSVVKGWNHLPMTQSPTRGVRVTAAVSELIFSPASGEDAVLRPAIVQLDMDEGNDQLKIYGSFGEDRKEQDLVTMNGTPLNVLSWSTGLIVCSIPRSGPGSAGDCVVIAGGHTSNARRLTAWSGTARWRRNYQDSEFFQIEWTVRFRADVGKVRSTIDSAPASRFVSAYATKDAQLTYSAGGTWTDDSDPNNPVVHTWGTNPGISVPYQIPSANPVGTDFDFRAYFDGTANTLSFGGNGYIPNGYNDVDSINGPPGNPQSLIGNGGSGFIAFPNGSNYDIAGGSVVRSQPIGNRVFDWDAMPAEFPPDPNAEL